MISIPFDCPLNLKELQVLISVANGHTREQIMKRFGITRRQFDWALEHSSQRLNTRSRVQTVAICMKHGWIKPESIEETGRG